MLPIIILVYIFFSHRWNSDGARFDSEAIAIVKKKKQLHSQSHHTPKNKFSDNNDNDDSSIDITPNNKNKYRSRRSSNNTTTNKNNNSFNHSDNEDSFVSEIDDDDNDNYLSDDDDNRSKMSGSAKSIRSIGTTNTNTNRHFNSENDHRWHELTDVEEMETYTPSVAADPAMRKKPMPGKLVRSKLKYIYLEAFGDLDYHVWGTFDFFMTVFLYFVATWVRLFIHYLGQYLFLQALATPVFGFTVYALFIQFKYSTTSISTINDIGVVAMGSVSCIIVFLILAFFGWIMHKYAKFLPESYSKFVIAFGIATIFDPILILFIDLCYHHYDCAQVSNACAISYTASDCNCYNGDFIKLWVHMLNLEGSGITGAIMTIMIYIAVMTISLLLVYMYLIYIHRDAHILDIWRRINGDTEDFFIPNDFEISLSELRSICVKASQWRGIDGSLREVIITSYETDMEMMSANNNENNEKYATNNAYFFNPASMTHKHDSGYLKRYLILQKNILHNESKLYRQFIMLKNGAIIEIFEQYKTKDPAVNLTTILPSKNETGKSMYSKLGGTSGGGGEYQSLIGEDSIDDIGSIYSNSMLSQKSDHHMTLKTPITGLKTPITVIKTPISQIKVGEMTPKAKVSFKISDVQ